VEQKGPLRLTGTRGPLESRLGEVERAGAGAARARHRHDAGAARVGGPRHRRESGATLDGDVDVPELAEDGHLLLKVCARVDVQAPAVATRLADRE